MRVPLVPLGDIFLIRLNTSLMSHSKVVRRKRIWMSKSDYWIIRMVWADNGILLTCGMEKILSFILRYKSSGNYAKQNKPVIVIKTKLELFYFQGSECLGRKSNDSFTDSSGESCQWGSVRLFTNKCQFSSARKKLPNWTHNHMHTTSHSKVL